MPKMNIFTAKEQHDYINIRRTKSETVLTCVYQNSSVSQQDNAGPKERNLRVLAPLAAAADTTERLVTDSTRPPYTMAFSMSHSSL
jgi:hypothetical protein